MYSEQTLVEELKKNSRKAHDQLVARYGQMIFAMIARIVSDVRDVQELTQDTLLTAIQKIYSFNPQLSRLSTWIGKIAYNKALSFARHRGHRSRKLSTLKYQLSTLKYRRSPVHWQRRQHSHAAAGSTHPATRRANAPLPLLLRLHATRRHRPHDGHHSTKALQTTLQYQKETL